MIVLGAQDVSSACLLAGSLRGGRKDKKLLNLCLKRAVEPKKINPILKAIYQLSTGKKVKNPKSNTVKAAKSIIEWADGCYNYDPQVTITMSLKTYQKIKKYL